MFLPKSGLIAKKAPSRCRWQHCPGNSLKLLDLRGKKNYQAKMTPISSGCHLMLCLRLMEPQWYITQLKLKCVHIPEYNDHTSTLKQRFHKSLACSTNFHLLARLLLSLQRFASLQLITLVASTTGDIAEVTKTTTGVICSIPEHVS